MDKKWTPRNIDKFYSVSETDIVAAEKMMKLDFPSELEEFYRDVGYGFINSPEKNINRLLDPLSVADLRLRMNEYEYYVDVELYDEFEEGKLLFFEANEGVLFSIELTKAPEQKIFFFDKVIANSLQEFLKKYCNNNYYYNV